MQFSGLCEGSYPVPQGSGWPAPNAVFGHQPRLKCHILTRLFYVVYLRFSEVFSEQKHLPPCMFLSLSFDSELSAEKTIQEREQALHPIGSQKSACRGFARDFNALAGCLFTPAATFAGRLPPEIENKIGKLAACVTFVRLILGTYKYRL